MLPLILPIFSPVAIRLEAERAALDGPTVATARKGYSGSGYATGLTKPGARIVWRINAKQGIYEVRLGYAAATERGFTISVDGDLSEYSPAAVAHVAPKDLVQQWIDAGRKGQIVTLTWHWDAPTDLTDSKAWGASFYTKNTAFDVQKALADPKGERYGLMLRDIDAIAVQLRRLQEAHVPVLWRPLHEAEGGWFWWGAKGPEAAKALYRLVFDRLTRVDGIHNLIWVWNSPKAEWYPGDDVVDVMSVDRYPENRRDAMSADWEDLITRFDGRKPVALAEFSGAPDITRMRRFGDRWLYFVSWYGNVGPRTTPPDVLRETYASPFVRSLPAKKP